MTLTCADKGRLEGDGLLRANAAYEAAVEPDGRIRLTEVEPEAIPVVTPRVVSDRLMGADVSLDRSRVAAAIRAERDAR